ncbi:MAG TPA: oxygenase MpaB family protein [Actinophytocola sp.]|uniref:oxygenase MpaB family protein n=1 Tax=Actinophytocola sp. TaxID=1872138 RepID=UPI002DDCC290|nr:oxygenase MpaB family protein [Actinophytocola sp.]HEV2783130.1 oxygenase MpaB family protein [Actinophytocola sp.]
MSTRLTEQQARALVLGPDSVAWRYGSDLRLFLASLSALLLQVAHPTVGSGVRDHSHFEAEPWARLFRTVDWVNLTIYGGQDAVQTGARLREMHRRIKGINPDGSRYHALEPGAYAWVHATLVYTIVDAHRMFGTPLSRNEIDELYREWLGIGRLIGVREGDLPDDWDGLLAYLDDTIATRLEHTTTVDTVLRASARPARPAWLPPWTQPLWRVLRRPMAHVLLLTGIGTLPPRLRDRLGLKWTKRQERELRLIARMSRGLTPVLPKAFRINGPAYLRARRAAIARDEFAPDSYRLVRNGSATAHG